MKSDMALNGKFALEAVIKRENERNADVCRCGKEDMHNYKLILMDCNMPIMDGI